MRRLVFVLGLVATSVMAAPRGSGSTGCLEGGWALGSAPRDGQFLVDLIEWNQRFTPSDRLHIVFNNVFSLSSPSTAPTVANNSVNYFSQFRLQTDTANTYFFTMANAGAYLDYRILDGLTVALGHMRTPFGAESVLSRYDTAAYFYSSSFRQAQAQGWLWDLGVLFTLKRRWIPGELTLGVLDGKAATGQGSPSVVARYEASLDIGRYTLVPSGSLYVGNFPGASNDLGFTLGLEALLGAFSLQAEWVQVDDATSTHTRSLYFEPAIDLGVAEVAAKADFQTQGTTSDMHLSFALTKMLTQRLRARALFQMAGLNGNIRAGERDFRILIGADW
ncbi:hypothetical protein K2X33_04970 [bacterium]|nr:hypothetical protein [bacterium]